MHEQGTTQDHDQILADLRSRANGRHPQPIYVGNDIANAAATDALKVFFDPRVASMCEGDHPLFLARVELKDGRTGTIVHVHDHAAAFMLELFEARGIEDLITILSHEIASVDYSPYDRAAAAASLYEGVINTDVSHMSRDEFKKFLRKDADA